MRHEFVQRRVEQTDGDGQPRHHLEQAHKVRALFGQQLGERHATPLLVLGQDHLAHGGNPRRFKEHMLGAAQPDALRAEFARDLGVGGGFGIGADLHPT